jgi:hypothetical protein
MRQLSSGVGVGAGGWVGAGVGAAVGGGVGGCVGRGVGARVGRAVGAAVGRAVGAGVACVPAVGAGVRDVTAVGATPPGEAGVAAVGIVPPGLPDAASVDPGDIDDRPRPGDALATGEPTGTSAGTLPPVPEDDGIPSRSAVARTIVTSSPKPTPTAVWRYNGSMLRSLSIGRLRCSSAC